MHADHAQPFGCIRGKRPQAHEGRCHRGFNRFSKLTQCRSPFRKDDATSRQDQRFFGLLDQLHHFTQLSLIGFVIGLIRFQFDGFGRFQFRLRGHHVLWKIHQHRTRPTTSGNMECLSNGSGEIFNLCNQIIVLGAGPGNPHDINLLKRIVSNQPGGHLPRKQDKGD